MVNKGYDIECGLETNRSSICDLKSQYIGYLYLGLAVLNLLIHLYTSCFYPVNIFCCITKSKSLNSPQTSPLYLLNKSTGAALGLAICNLSYYISLFFCIKSPLKNLDGMYSCLSHFIRYIIEFCYMKTSFELMVGYGTTTAKFNCS